MINGPKYKIARRLGANIFEKTQTQKFAMRQERRGGKGPYRPKGEFATAMLEKQKVRYTYGVLERQFKKYVKESVAKKGINTVQALYERLETRLDNAVYRLGWAPTRLAARQMVSHGHITVNNTRTNVPSHQVSVGDTIAVRPGSLKKPLFKDFDEKTKNVSVPSWLSFNHDKKTAEVTGAPKHNPTELLFNLGQVIEFYSR
ncbi:MAG: 30S ribosomal protein S4 [Patescibacteria group bacterium]|nr:30S ribosomal protein S4 [Patescibacteria group bacterium]MDE2116814.1 30S ribosomal protein S4 [Patescibacteria group bacterium]